MDVEISQVGPSASDSTMTDPVSDKVLTETDNKRKRTHSLEIDRVKSMNSFTRVLNKKMSKQNKRIDPSQSTASNVSPIQSQPSKRSCKAKSQMSGLDDEVLLCVFCGESTNPTDSIRCDECKEMYHLLCCQVDVECHSDLLSLTSFLGWMCCACRFDSAAILSTLKKSVTDLANELKQLGSSVHLAIKSLMSRSEPTADRQTSLSFLTQVDTTPPATTPTIHGSIVAEHPTTVEPLTVNIDSHAPSQPAPPMQYSDVVRLVTKTIPPELKTGGKLKKSGNGAMFVKRF